MEKLAVHHQTAVSDNTVTIAAILIMQRNYSIESAFSCYCVFIRKKLFYRESSIIFKFSPPVDQRNADFRCIL